MIRNRQNRHAPPFNKEIVPLEIKILGIKPAQRYAVRRLVISAWDDLCKPGTNLQVSITQIKDVDEILRYTEVIAGPALIVNEKLVCVGRIPSKKEILDWIRLAVG